MGEDQGAACKPAGTARECVNSECFPSASSMSTTRCCSLALCVKKKKETLNVVSHAKFMYSSQSNMLDNMLSLSVKVSCCTVVFPCGVC